MRPLVVLGDLLLDEDVDGRTDRLCPDAPAPVLDVGSTTARPGGAGLAAVLAAADGRPVRLVAALDRDDAARRLRALLEGCVTLVAGPGTGGTAVKTRMRADGRVLLRADRGEGRAGDRFGAEVGIGRALRGAGAVLVSDYGRGVAADHRVRAAVGLARRSGTPVVWDPHPRGPAPVPGATVVTPNLSEACAVLDAPAPDAGDAAALAELAGALRRRWAVGEVVITLGARGAALDGRVLAAPEVSGGDPCGAGDRFAGRLAAALAEGADLPDAVATAVDAASRFVADGGAGAVRRTARGWCRPSPVPAAGA
jgi:D-beta-D-heptose 7-phosphate kinase / D-beta-D-heptose 1-phosphate adenosyltransferase